MSDPSPAFLTSRLHLERLVAAAAARDPSFRARLRADPRATVTQLVGCPLPDSLDIRVVEPDAAGIVAVLRTKARQASPELAEHELAAMAGGARAPAEAGRGQSLEFATLERALQRRTMAFRRRSDAAWAPYDAVVRRIRDPRS